MSGCRLSVLKVLQHVEYGERGDVCGALLEALKALARPFRGCRGLQKKKPSYM